YIILIFMLTSTLDIYILSLHDALPIFLFSEFLRGCFSHKNVNIKVKGFRLIFIERKGSVYNEEPSLGKTFLRRLLGEWGCRKLGDRKSTRLNSSHVSISYAVFCLKKKI